MEQNFNPTRRLTIGLLVTVGVLAMALPATAERPPSDRTYFVIALGLAGDRAEAYDMTAGCLSFRGDEMCDTDGDCGEWWRIEEENALSRRWPIGFDLSVVDDETGLLVEIVGTGRVDSRGPRSSLAAAAHGIDPSSGSKMNFAVAGRAVGPRQCERLVARFEAAQQDE